MSAGGHTPGPWRGVFGNVYSVSHVDSERPERGTEVIAEHVGPHNMPLIVAAPALADALEAVLSRIGHTHILAEEPCDLRDAISAAYLALRAAGRLP